MRRVRPKPIASIQGAHTIHASPSCVPALQSQSPVALPLDVRPSVPVLYPWREQCSQSRVRGKRAALALSLPVCGWARRLQGSGYELVGRRGSPWASPLLLPEVAAAVRAAAAPAGPWVPPDAARPRTHTPARTRSRRAVFPGPGPRLWEGRGSRAPMPGGWGAPGTPGSWPPCLGCAPPPRPLSARGGDPLALSPFGPRAFRRLRVSSDQGGWGRVGAAGSGPRGGSAPRRGKFGRGKLPPRLPRQEEGARGGRAREPWLPLRREARPPRRPPGGSSGPGGSLQAGQPPLGGDVAAPPAAPRALTSGSGPGLPPVLPPRGAACGGSPGAGGRASPEPGGRPEEPEGERAREGEPRRRVRACV